MTILNVGATESYKTISSAVTAAHSGDTIRIDAGNYSAHDVMLNKDLTITAAGNGPVVISQGGALQKGMFISGSSSTTPNITVQGLTFQNATDPSGNGTGIRYQSGNLTLIGDTFRNSQDGILATPFKQNTGTIIVQGSTFDHNGMSTGLGHNLYIDGVADFVMTNSVSENAVVGHELKSRAFNNDIENNLIMDGPTGTSSYSIDIPNGGNTIIQGNTIEQGPKSQNPMMIAYGEEGNLHPGSLTVTGNVLLNDLSRGKGIWNHTSTPATVSDNQTWGLTSSTLLTGPGSLVDNIALALEPLLGSSPGSSSSTGPSSKGMSFVGGSIPGQISASASVADPLGSSGSGATGSPQTSGVASSDFVTDEGTLTILQGPTLDPSAAPGLYVDPTNNSQVLMAGMAGWH